MPRRRPLIGTIVCLLAIVISLLATVSPAAGAVRSIRLTQPTIVEASDYASESFADAWDFSNAEDHSVSPGVRMSDLTSPTMSFGQFSASSGPSGHLWMLDSWDDDGLPWGRDGALHPIDASRFRRVSFRMWTNATPGEIGAIHFSTCGRIIPECLGRRSFPLVNGWHTYDVEIGDDAPEFQGSWTGQPRGFGVTPRISGGQFRMDFVRVYEPSTNGVRIEADDVGTAAPTTVYWDSDTNPANNTADNPGWGPVGTVANGAVTFPSDQYPPGTYYFYAQGTQGTVYTSGLTIDAQPRARILQPDIAGGVDYATAVLGDPWDFSQASDVATFWNAAGAVAGGVLNGSNTGPSLNDPGVMVPSGSIDATRWHRLVARVSYDGTFSLSGSPGGGMNARLAWHLPNSSANDVSDDIVVYPEMQEVAIDLNTFPSGAVTDTGNGLGWNGRTVDRVRFDPHEDPGVRGFHIDELRLAQDDEGIGSYDITFLDDAFEPGTTATLYVDNDNGGLNGTQIGTVNMVAGVNTFRWTPPRDLLGTWWIHIRITDPGGTTSTAYSTGPVRLLGQSIPSTPSRFVAVSPTRVLDTRTGQGRPVAGPVGPGASIDVQVTGLASVPAEATAVVMNVTATETAAPGYITAWPAGYVQPLASNLNIETQNQTIPNLVTVPIGTRGQVSLYTQGGGHLIADVAGYYVPATSATAGRYRALTPARVLDTRDGNGGTTGLVPNNGTIGVQIAGRGGVPATGASAVVLNVTATEATAAGYVTVWPSGSGLPTASNLNVVRAGQTIPNQVIVPLGADGRIQLYTQSATHLLADVAGYFTDGSAPSSSSGLFVPLAPSRLLDTREGNGAPLDWVDPGAAVGLQVTGRGGVPAGATGAVMNVTATFTLFPGFVTVWPSGAAMPVASNLNIERFLQTIPNHTTATLSPTGGVSLFTQGGADLIADVFGYYTL